MGIKPSEMADEMMTAVFSYDAMVHFEPECVKQYVLDAYRVLKSGGKALLHQSNYAKNKNRVLSNNPGWRNYMSQELFAANAKETVFIVMYGKLISSVEPDSDCVTLLQKSALLTFSNTHAGVC
jgi:cyclopropane fatty-acyl-phospholipid synthase-like methyltransferase